MGQAPRCDPARHPLRCVHQEPRQRRAARPHGHGGRVRQPRLLSGLRTGFLHHRHRHQCRWRPLAGGVIRPVRTKINNGDGPMLQKCGAATRLGGAILLSMGLAGARAEDGPRFPQPTMEQLSAEQQAVAAEVLKQSSAGLGGPYGMLIKSPELLKRYLLMTDYLRQKTSLPHRLNEMAILLEARLWDAQYEWWAHEPLARKAGLPEAISREIREGKRPASMEPDEAIVFDLVNELLNKR